MRIAILVLALLPLPCFAQTISVSAITGRSPETWHGRAEMQSVNIEYAHPIASRTELAFVLSPTSIDQPTSGCGDDYGAGNARVRALAGALLLRHRFNDSTRVQFYGEAGTGPMWAEKAVPASTSRFNFVTQFGAGIVLMPASRTPVVLGYRLNHISNGGYAPRNPGLNVSSLVLGIRWRTR
ncbi:MAG TPA: acyloxyacyl hydrolase [Thermoanaerobaculia bacterium]|nr:acyloxyacyl hydrolase [Thermoanaerobaculia bacterium]